MNYKNCDSKCLRNNRIDTAIAVSSIDNQWSIPNILAEYHLLPFAFRLYRVYYPVLIKFALFSYSIV